MFNKLRLDALQGLLVQAAVYWVAVALIGTTPVTLSAWWVLQAGLAVALWGTYRWCAAARLPARCWCELAIYSVLGALLFAGANFGMDALHGAHRPKADVAGQLGGLELWFVLCPGLFSLALGRLASPTRASPMP